MSEINMNEKYQNHYNKVLTGTLTDTLMKSISYQANIQLANEIIADQEKIIQELQAGKDTSKKQLEATIESLKNDLEIVKTNKTNLENSKIVSLENTIKSNQANITRLQNDLFEANKLRTEYENVKHQVQHLDTYRKEVIKANDTIKDLKESHDSIKNDYEEKIKALTAEIETLKTPVVVKKTKSKKAIEVVESTPKAKIIKQTLPGLIVKDGGSF